MAKNKKKSSRPDSVPEYTLHYGQKTIRFILDKVLIFRFLQRLKSELWGVAGVLIMCLGFAVCFAVRPDMRDWSTALSDFGRDVRTAPYLAAALFFGAYGLWRWRGHLRRSLKRTRPIIWLMSLTVLGLYVAALMPVAWEPWPHRIHVIGVSLAGISMAATVVADTLLTKVRRRKFATIWRLLRFVNFLMIIIGGVLTYGSIAWVGWFNLALLGELLMLVGYASWIIDKTYRGEGSRSELSKLLRKIVLID